MSDTDRVFSPPSMPGYTGEYAVEPPEAVRSARALLIPESVPAAHLWARQPDGKWVPVKPYSEFKTKEVQHG